MPRIVVTAGARAGMDNCRRFLATKAPQAARRAADAIGRHLSQLETMPEIGRPLPDEPILRELVIPFGDTGYIALYRYDNTRNIVYILAFRHQKEAGY